VPQFRTDNPETVEIDYEIHTDGHSMTGRITVPYYLSMDPKLAVALYFFGHQDATEFVDSARVVN
jgi:hypothetical protein